MVGALVVLRGTRGCEVAARGVLGFLEGVRHIRLLTPGWRWWGSSEDGSISAVSESLMTRVGSPSSDIEEASPFSWDVRSHPAPLHGFR